MAGLFIDVKVKADVASDADIVAKLVEVCPVDIFEQVKGGVKIIEDNLDECVLCDLCIEVAPRGSVEVIKLYE